MSELKDRVNQARAENSQADSEQTGGEVQPVHPLTRVKDLLDHMAPEIAKAVPAHMTAERLARIAFTQVRKDPQLALCTADSLAGAILTCAQLGLEPGPTGEAYIIPRKNKGVLEATFQLGYKGMATLFWQHPLAMYLDAQTVYENDSFDYEYGVDAYLRHKPAEGDRGNPRGLWYAVAKLVTGGYRFVVLDRKAVNRRRNKGTAPNSPAWTNDFDQMAEKSCVKDLFDLLPKSSEMSRALAQDGMVRTDLSADALDVEAAYVEEADVVEDTPAANDPSWPEGAAPPAPATGGES